MVSTKKCRICDEVLLITEFRISNKKTGNRRTECKECGRALSRANAFIYTRGITYEERDDMLKQQEHKCKCCGKDESGSKKGWHVDHCHRTDEIRGVLCANCNIALGQVDDNIEHLYKLIKYLREFEKNGSIL